MTLIQLFTAIAIAIRSKTVSQETIAAEDFPQEISNISTGIDTSDATATADDIVVGKTAYVNGQKITGTLTRYPPLPYKELEYIESTGTQYIDTGIEKKITNVIRYVGKFSYADTQTRQLNGAAGLYYVGVLNGYYQIAQGGQVYTNVPAPTNTFVDFDITFNGSSKTCSYTINSVSDTMSQIAYASTTDNVYLFINSNLALPSSCKISYWKIYKDGTLVRDLIPVKRKSDNEICMYDKVTEQFFTNQGTGSFIAGNEI